MNELFKIYNRKYVFENDKLAVNCHDFITKAENLDKRWGGAGFDSSVVLCVTYQEFLEELLKEYKFWNSKGPNEFNSNMIKITEDELKMVINPLKFKRENGK